MAERKFIEITKGNSRVIIDPVGSRIRELVLNGHRVSGVVTRGDGKEASSHPGSPNFGPDTAKLGLTQHGPIRNERLRVESQYSGVLSNAVVFSYKINAGKYPHGVSVGRAIALYEDQLFISSTYHNQGTEPAPVNHGEHFYIDTPDGWDDMHLNGKNISDLIRNDLVASWKVENLLERAGQPDLIIVQHGLGYVNPWTGTNAQGVHDKHYVSISGLQGDFNKGFFGSGSPSSVLKPGQHKGFMFSVGLR